MPTQCVPGPLHSKGKLRVFFLQEVLFAHVVHSVGVNIIWTSHRTSTRIRHFSFWEGRDLLTSMLLW